MEQKIEHKKWKRRFVLSCAYQMYASIYQFKIKKLIDQIITM